jgi:hypothetical protein
MEPKSSGHSFRSFRVVLGEWNINGEENVKTRMMVVPKGAITATLKAELEQAIEEVGLQKNPMAQETLYTKGNSKKTDLKNFVVEETNVGAIPHEHHG